MTSGLNYAKLMEEQDHLITGRPMLQMNLAAPLSANARAIQEQSKDILYLFSNLDADEIYALDESLEEALAGFIQFAEKLEDIKMMAEHLQESGCPDIPAVGDVLMKLREHAADQGVILKTLYGVTQKFIQADAAQQQG